MMEVALLGALGAASVVVILRPPRSRAARRLDQRLREASEPTHTLDTAALYYMSEPDGIDVTDELVHHFFEQYVDPDEGPCQQHLFDADCRDTYRDLPFL